MSPLSLNCKRVLLANACTLVFGALLLTASPAALSHYKPLQEDEAKWLVRLMVLGINQTNIRSEVSGISGNIEIPSTVKPGLDISYFVTNHWAIEFQGGVTTTDYRIIGSAIGDFDIGSVETASAGLTLQYHFRPKSTLRPYLGIGVNYSKTRDVTPADNIPDFEIDDITSLILNTGIDYQLDDSWFASASLRYLVIPTYHAEGQAFDTEITLNTLIPGVGVSYRF